MMRKCGSKTLTSGTHILAHKERALIVRGEQAEEIISLVGLSFHKSYKLMKGKFAEDLPVHVSWVLLL